MKKRKKRQKEINFTKDGVPIDSPNQKEQEAELARLHRIVQMFGKQKRQYIVPCGKGNELLFAVAGDLQIGSLYKRIDALIEFLKICVSEGVRILFVPGDILDGWNIYRGQTFEQDARGFDEQMTAFKDEMPRYQKLKTYFITGNHDESYTKLTGIDMKKQLEEASKKIGLDWTCVGSYFGNAILKTPTGNRYKVQMLHPDGGTAYAISYKLQKVIESYPGGEKPDCLLEGHYHKALEIPMYRNVVGFESGCFQSQTPYMARKPTPAHVGGWIVKVTTGTKAGLSQRVQSEFIAFYEPEKK